MTHHSRPSSGSMQDYQSIHSETALDREYGTPLRQVVAVYHSDDGAPYFAIEVDCLDEDYNYPSAMTLRFAESDERDKWLRLIRSTANEASLADPYPISPYNQHKAAQAVETERDYDPAKFALYKVVQRPHKSGQRSSAEDLTKVASLICFLAIGVHKIHIISLFKKNTSTSTPQHASSTSQRSYGILSLTDFRLNHVDDTFELTFRIPFQTPRTLYLASVAGRDISARFQQVEELLRPEWETRPYLLHDPERTRADSMVILDYPPTGPDCFDTTLTAYCMAYGIRPDNVRYLVTDDIEDGPKFELFPPANTHRSNYNELELLAIMRALRYNESFGTLSFANVHLDALNDTRDEYGSEHVCYKTKRGTPLRMKFEDLCEDRLLVQEIRALAATSKKLRRLDFTNSIVRQPKNSDENEGGARDLGCGIAEALFPLCKLQITNIDWIVLNGIQFGETDLDYLVGAAVDRNCHFRALELGNCGLTDRTLMLLLDTLRAQDNTLEALDISRNVARLSPSTFGPQLGIFGFLRRLNLSHLSRTSDADSLIPLDTIMAWRLEELTLSGTSVNAATLDVICRYLLSTKSDLLRELRLDHTYLSGKDMAMLMRAVARHPGGMPQLHVDLSQNRPEKDHQHLIDALKDNLTPSLLTIRLLEYEEQERFRDFVKALTTNNSITHLDISKASLALDASEETCQSLERMFSDNTNLEYLDISGEKSRLEDSKLGVGIDRAIAGLKRNTTLKCLRIQSQNLGLRGAHTLADVIQANDSLVELHCEGNALPLSGFMDIVNALESNTTLQLVLGVEDSQHDAHHIAELQIKSLRDEMHGTNVLTKPSSVRSRIASRVASNTKPRTPTSPVQHVFKATNEALEALDDLDKVWNKQIERLQFYLYRNQCLTAGVPVPMRFEDQASALDQAAPDASVPSPGRPLVSRSGSTMTIEKILSSVDIDATPRAEKQLQLGDATTPQPQAPSLGYLESELLPLSPSISAEGDHDLLREFQDAIERNASPSIVLSEQSHVPSMVSAGL